MNGQTSALCPVLSLQKRDILSVEHPCIIHNLRRGIASLGDSHQINQFLDSDNDPPKKSLCVSLRPEDAFATSIPSKHVTTNCLLLKLTVPKRTGGKRKRGSNEPYSHHVSPPNSGRTDATAVYHSIRDNPDRYSIEATGRVENSYKFKSMTVFQFAKSPFMHYMEKTLLSTDFESIRSFKLNTAQALKPDEEIQIPPLLQLTESPFPFNYRQNSAVRVETDKTGKDISYNTQTFSAIPANIIALEDEAPTAPPSTLPPEDSLDARTKALIRLLRTEMEKRPILTTRVQLYLTKATGYYNIRRALPYVGYLFRGGPFKDALIKFGVDPRTDSKYRIYQVHAVQLASNLKGTNGRFGIGEPKSKTRPKTHIFSGTEIYTDGRVYQVCDVTDPTLKRLAETATVSEQYEPTTRGWYKSGTWGLFRTLLKDKIDRLIKGTLKPDSFYDDIILQWPEEFDDLPKEFNSGGDPDAATLMSKAKANCRNVENTIKYAERNRSKRPGARQPEEDAHGALNLEDSGLSEQGEASDTAHLSERDDNSDLDDVMDTEVDI